MPKLIDNTHKLYDGDVVLYKRKNSSEWQVRLKIKRQWVRKSTNQKQLILAKEAAKDLYMDYQFKLRNNVPIVTHTFKSVAEVAIRNMQQALDNNHGKVVYRDYIFAINNYLIPFFGKRHIDNIKYADFLDFEQWRMQKLGKQPRASTVGTHNSAYNKVCDEALRLGYMQAGNKMDLRNNGSKAERRPDFTAEEFKKLADYMPAFIEKARDGKSREMRELLQDYVLVLTSTGIRHGIEAHSLRWKQVRIDNQGGESRLLFSVNGKTGYRELVAPVECINVLKRIHQRTQSIKHLTFDQLLQSQLDLPVFTLSDGTVTNNLRQTFKALLKDKELNLLKCPRTDKDRTLYSLRHTYATLQLANSTNPNIHLLSKQMGTSVQMIEKHYSHLVARQRAKDLVGNEYSIFSELMGGDRSL